MSRGWLPQKKVLISFTVLFVLGIVFILFQNILQNPLTFAVGPIRQAVVIGLSLLACAAFDFSSTIDLKKKGIAWAIIAAGCLIQILTIIVTANDPGTQIAKGLLRWNFIGWVLIFWGAFSRWIPGMEKLGQLSAKISDCQLFLLLSFTLLVFVYPVLKSGFYWDDAYFSAQIPAMKLDGVSVWRRIIDEAVLYAGRGRINPFATFQFLTFYFLQNETAYKIFLVILSGLDCFLFYQFIKIFWRRSRSAVLMLLMLPVCVQFRIYHDPMTSYYGLMQMMFAELMLSLIFLFRYLDAGRKRHLFGSLLFFLLGLTSYELFYPMILLIILAVWQRRRKPADVVRVSLPFILLEAALLILTFVLRTRYAQSGEVYQGTVFALNPLKIAGTWFNQITASFPLTYRLAENDAMIHHRLVQAGEIFTISPIDFIHGVRWGDLLALTAAGIVLLACLNRLEKDDRPAGIHWLFGILLLAVSGIVIALSEKYQFQITFGIGYIPIWFGYFGAVYLAGCLLFCLTANRERFFSSVFFQSLILAMFAVIFLFNQQTNRRVISLLNEGLLFPREVGEAALEAGILRESADRETRILSNNVAALWESGWNGKEEKSPFYSLYHGEKVMMADESVLRSLAASDGAIEFSSAETDFTLVAYDGDADSGLAKVAHAVYAEGLSESGTLINAVVRDVFFFVSGTPSENAAVAWVRWDGSGQTLPLTEAWLIRQTERGSLYKLNDPHALYFDSIGLTRYR